MAFCTRRLTDRAAIRAFLGRDRALAAYALGDLDDAFWPQSAFFGAERGGALAAVALCYAGLDPAVLTVFGTVEGAAAIFAQTALPDDVYYLLPPEMEALLRARYGTPGMHREWRMVLDPAASAPIPADGAARILPEQAGELAALYRHAAAPGEEVVAFSPWQIAHGVFFGVWEGGRLIATAGTHVWSPAEGVAAVGNVFTHPAARGRGHASRCSAAVVRAALTAGIATVVLNVRQDNAAAIRVYERLGFRPYATFLEGPARRRVGTAGRNE